MKVTAALSAWIADAEAQERCFSFAADVKERLQQADAVRQLDRKLEEIGDADDAAAILGCARSFLDDDEAVGRHLELLIEAGRNDPFFRPPVRTASGDVHRGLVLYDRPQLTLLLAVASPEALAAKRRARRGSASIVFAGQKSVYRFIRAGGATLSLWEAPAIGPDFTAGKSGRCRLVERRRLADGEPLELDGSRQSFVVDHLESELVYLHATTPAGAAPLSVEYDSETLAFAGASSTDEAGSRTQLMLSLLRIMERTDAAPLFARMLESRHFNARWSAMREFLALDAEAALPHLRALAERDPHPEVRAAARQTLEAILPALEAEEPEPCPA